MCECGLPGGALNPSSTSYPEHGRCGELPLQGNIPTAEPGIEPVTSWLVVRRSDSHVTGLVDLRNIVVDTSIKVCGHCLHKFLRHTFLLTVYKHSFYFFRPFLR
jgi:hypothetical protein